MWGWQSWRDSRRERERERVRATAIDAAYKLHASLRSHTTQASEDNTHPPPFPSVFRRRPIDVLARGAPEETAAGRQSGSAVRTSREQAAGRPPSPLRFLDRFLPLGLSPGSSDREPSMASTFSSPDPPQCFCGRTRLGASCHPQARRQCSAVTRQRDLGERLAPDPRPVLPIFAQAFFRFVSLVHARAAIHSRWARHPPFFLRDYLTPDERELRVSR